MRIDIEALLNNWNLNPGVSSITLNSVIATLEFELPSDYVDFLKKADGGEGFLGENYLILWKAEELKVFNQEYEVDEYAKGIFLFGSNGSGEGYGFDLRKDSLPIVRIPFIGMDLCYADNFADNFSDMLLRLTQ